MKAIITKPICVVGDNKSTVRFEPSTQNTPFVEVSNQVYARLKRANAAKPFVESKTNAKPDTTSKKVEKEENKNGQISTEEVVEEITPKQTKTSKVFKPATSTPKKA
ncbi:hypothetical protein [Bartonella harrusi]|uniref:Uncharacterized protein n=1 Tax=Bartonella harrusi TaxID=2961895 RepID=A0ABY5EU84_9HYPH|nr:hypothetical protein [Bartonella harrusi]UTO27828.1 hypothetical protein NMK50_06165 [Bartonella harrusi]UTO28719.1 hypothetical protein NMK50_01480 [Bartonella harrusi]